MQHQLIRHGQGSRTWAIVLDHGEEVNACLQEFARREVLSPTHFTATGILQDAILGYLEADKHHYRSHALDRPVQIVSLVGDVALREGTPQIQARAVLGDDSGATFDGHLLKAHAGAALNVIMTEAPVQLHKGYDADAGLALFKTEEKP
jgi:predicted DNA-binding protein with PD1-like motif